MPIDCSTCLPGIVCTLPYPSNPNYYYRCINGKASMGQCSTGKRFSADISRCVSTSSKTIFEDADEMIGQFRALDRHIKEISKSVQHANRRSQLLGAVMLESIKQNRATCPESKSAVE